MENCQIDELMARRQSCRNFNPDFEIPKKSLEALLESLRLSPTAYGTLNYRVLVFERSKTRDELNPIFYDQKNFITASAVVLFVADNWHKLQTKTAKETASLMFPRKEDTDTRERFLNNFHVRYDHAYGHNPKLGNAWSEKQVYISLGVGIVAAEAMSIDCCPLGGFDEKELNEWLINHELIEKDEMAVVALALGESAETNHHPKIRKPIAEFAKRVK